MKFIQDLLDKHKRNWYNREWYIVATEIATVAERRVPL